MRIFTIQPQGVSETHTLEGLQLPQQGYVWVSCTRHEFGTPAQQALIQATLQSLCGLQLVDLHVSDLLNAQLPSHYDYTSQYDLMVFRRLATGHAGTPEAQATGPAAAAPAGAHAASVPAPASAQARAAGPPILRRIDTNPVGFAVFDQVLLTVHPSDCAVRDAYAHKLLHAVSPDARAGGARAPSSPADLMLRIINLMVDGFLELRRELTRQLDHWQTELINPRTRFTNWGALLDARLSLHQLDQVCEDQRAAIQDWIEALKTWPDATTPAGQRERDLLQVRSRDVQEHIERVVSHVRRLEQNAETAVQMHFSAQSHRTNDIMRTLTVLTAIFLPLNLIAGIFGMNFEFIPLLHVQDGFWLALAAMMMIAIGLAVFFWRKRYLTRNGP